MFFKGTERRPTAKDISAEVDGIGGEFNAFTSKEYTGYYIKCAAELDSCAGSSMTRPGKHRCSKFEMHVRSRPSTTR